MEEKIERARSGSKEEIHLLIFSPEEEVLLALLSNASFTEREALILLNRKDLPASIIKELAGLRQLSCHHDIQLAILRNPKTPPFVSLPLVKFLFPFELMTLCLLPALPMELKQAAEGLLISQLPQLALGQRIHLAKRGSSNIVKNLLTGDNPAIFQAALNNPYITEETLIQALQKPQCSGGLVAAVAAHSKWSVRYPLRLALVRHPLISLAVALRLIADLRPGDLRSIATESRVNPEIRRFIQNKLTKDKH
jgi:hypothetical protein